jgi:hypothetical protein
MSVGGGKEGVRRGLSYLEQLQDVVYVTSIMCCNPRIFDRQPDLITKDYAN